MCHLSGPATAHQSPSPLFTPTRFIARQNAGRDTPAFCAADVQSVADTSPDQAATIIASAAMASKKAPARNKVAFTAKPGATSGTVQLVVKAAARRASYEWAWSADGGKTWTLAPSTLQARTTLTGIPAGTNAQFRYRAVTKTGEGDWSQPISLLLK
jgi:hypothetical protein